VAITLTRGGYPFIWLDAIHFTVTVKDEGRYVSKAVYTILGLNADGKKELLGLYLSYLKVKVQITGSLC